MSFEFWGTFCCPIMSYIYFLFFSVVILCTSNLFRKTIGQNLATDCASEAKSQPPKVFGCIAFAHVPDAQRWKLDKKSEKLHFVGYSKETKGYRLLDEKTSKVIIRRDVRFNETDFGYTEAVKSRKQSK